jgi:hypothetical protein
MRKGALAVAISAYALLACDTTKVPAPVHSGSDATSQTPGLAPATASATDPTPSTAGPITQPDPVASGSARGVGGGGPTKKFAVGATFELRRGQSAALSPGDLTIVVESVDYSPMQGGPGGMELFPYSVFHLAVRCGGQTRKIKVSGGSTPVCGFLLDVIKVEGEDDGFFSVTSTN